MGPRSIICGYENLFDKKAEFSYKALMHLDGYGIRKKAIKPILESDPEYAKQILSY